jgi:hypothetical protein
MDTIIIKLYEYLTFLRYQTHIWLEIDVYLIFLLKHRDNLTNSQDFFVNLQHIEGKIFPIDLDSTLCQ